MQIKHSTDGLSIPHVSSTKKIFIANNDKSHRVCVCVCVSLAYGFFKLQSLTIPWNKP